MAEKSEESEKTDDFKKENEQKRTTDKKAGMLAAMKKTMGIVSASIEKAGIVRSTHYKWMDEDADYRKGVEDVTEYVIDFAESKLHNQINDGNLTATIFYLKTKGKKRGYVERIENVNQDVHKYFEWTQGRNHYKG